MLDNMPRGTICIEDIEIGMVRYLRKVVTDRDIEMFAEISTDHNPVHLDDDYANDTIFEGRIAHGMLTAGLISAVNKVDVLGLSKLDAQKGPSAHVVFYGVLWAHMGLGPRKS